MHTPNPFSDLSFCERPTVLRDRDDTLKALKLALLRFSWQAHAQPGASLDHVTRDFLRDLQASGIELKRTRKVHP